MMRRVLVIGANGFLGRHVFRLLSRQPELAAVGTSRAGSPDLARLDLILDPPAVVGAVLAAAHPDVVVNCAGAVSGEAADLAAANVTGPAKLVGALARYAPGTRLVHLGSAAEYGLTEPRVPITETREPHPVGVYGVSKLAGTETVALARTFGLDTLVLRVFNPIGAGAPATSLPGRLLAELCRATAEHDAVHLGSLDSVRDFVDVRDIADAVLAAVQSSTVDEPVLNVASGRATPVRILVRDLVRLSGFTGPVFAIGNGSVRSADVPWQQADVSAIARELGWKPAIDLMDSLREMWQAVTDDAND
jgi:nucleoside-diphosphate-sugar epimerase